MRRAHVTSPGPDGIPYKACQKLGKYAACSCWMLPKTCRSHRCAHQNGPRSIMLCCLPKSSRRHDIVHGDLDGANGTRLLAVVNADSRLLANAYRRMLEPTLNKWVSEMQRGFLHGRSISSNIVDLDFCAMRISLNHPKRASVLFDFAAAFLSISQEFMWQVLSHVGLPPPVFEAVRRFYCSNCHYVKG